MVEENLSTPRENAPQNGDPGLVSGPIRRRRIRPATVTVDPQQETVTPSNDRDKPVTTQRQSPSIVPKDDDFTSAGSMITPLVGDQALPPAKRWRRPRRPVADASGHENDSGVDKQANSDSVIADDSENKPSPARRRRRKSPGAAEALIEDSTAPEIPKSDNVAPVAGLNTKAEESLAASEEVTVVRRRRRGHRGGVGRRRQTAEQAVAGIAAEPPVSESRPIDGRIADEWTRGDRTGTAPPTVSEDMDDWGGSDVSTEEENEGPEQRHIRRRPARSLAEIDSTPSKTNELSFMHPSEREFANLLDYYQIKFLYEPRSFPLRWDGNRVVEMHTPDFYLPEYDQYFELTTMKQSLVTQKNRKLRHVRELYPEINIQLLYRRDLMRLLGKYGFGPLADVDVNGTDRVLFSEEQVQQRVRELGEQISQDYAGQEPVLIGVLRGVVVFMADLMRSIDLPLQIEFMEISHYGEEREEAIEVLRDVNTEIRGRPVIVIEDIVDTGLTLRYLLEHLQAKEPESVQICCLLDKSVRRMAQVPLDYVGFEIPDEFVIGYGLDYGGRYRNLRHIGVLMRQEPKAVPQR